MSMNKRFYKCKKGWSKFQGVTLKGGCACLGANAWWRAWTITEELKGGKLKSVLSLAIF